MEISFTNRITYTKIKKHDYGNYRKDKKNHGCTTNK